MLQLLGHCLAEVTARSVDMALEQVCKTIFFSYPGELCRGKAINPDTEVCCCGEVHRAQRGYKCCGVEYYNTLAHECCDEKRANVVPKGERCPNVVFNKILRKIDLN